MVNLKRVFLSLIGLFVLINCGTETVTYTLDVTPSPPEGGTVTPTNEVYQEGEEIQLLATPSEGWRFVDWDGDWSTSDNPTSVIMNKNYTIKGNFTKRDYPLNIEMIGEGTVKEEIISQKTTDYPYGTVVRLTPKPNQDWRFDGWSGDISDENDVIELTIDKETNIKVTFLPNIISFPESNPRTLTLLDTTVVIGLKTASNEGVFSDNPNVGTYSYVLITLDTQGNVLNKRYEASIDTYLNLKPISDTEFLLIGNKGSNLILRKYDKDLNLIFGKSLGSNSYRLNDFYYDSINNQILTAGSNIGNVSTPVFKVFDIDGNVLNELRLQGSGDGTFQSFILLPDVNKVKMFGFSQSSDGDFTQIYDSQKFVTPFITDLDLNTSDYVVSKYESDKNGYFYSYRVNENEVLNIDTNRINNTFANHTYHLETFSSNGDLTDSYTLFEPKNNVTITSISKENETGYLLTGSITSKDGTPNPYPVELPDKYTDSFIMRLNIDSEITDFRLFSGDRNDIIIHQQIGEQYNYFLESYYTPRPSPFTNYNEETRLIIELKQ